MVVPVGNRSSQPVLCQIDLWNGNLSTSIIQTDGKIKNKNQYGNYPGGDQYYAIYKHVRGYSFPRCYLIFPIGIRLNESV
jgi:hypothetical protein